ncbi:hypothetical protein BH10ACI4_BH10ACI4_10310 [soil metagenome]
MHASQKKLNEMNRLSDMLHFPPLVNAGTTLNILITLTITWWLVPRYPQPFAPVLWIALVLVLNLLPVVLLRLTITPNTVYRPLDEMDFVHDQHKFSDWVYVAASANIAFWVLSGWALFSLSHTPLTLFADLLLAAFATFSPVLLRALRSSQ